MEKLNDHEFYKFNPNSLHDVRKLYNLEKPGAMADAVDILEEWVKKQAHFLKKDFDRGYLERTIIRAKGSIEISKQRLDKLCTSKTSYPMFFVNRKTNEFEDLEILEDTMLPQPTSDNYRIYLLRNVGKEFTDKLVLNYFKRVVHMVEHQYAQDYVNGAVFVLDYTECSLWNLIKCVDAGLCHNIFNIVLNCYGLRVKAVHMISPSKAIDAFVAILKTIISAKMASRIHVHKTIESVYMHVDKALLPVEYGGNQKSLSEIHKQFVDMVSREDFQDYLKTMYAAGTDESYRPTDKFNEQCLGLPGTFRSLKVD